MKFVQSSIKLDRFRAFSIKNGLAYKKEFVDLKRISKGVNSDEEHV
jgi:hypothetical protein